MLPHSNGIKWTIVGHSDNIRAVSWPLCRQPVDVVMTGGRAWVALYSEITGVQPARGRIGMCSKEYVHELLEPRTKLAPCFLVENRDAQSALMFIDDLAGRLKGRI